MHFPRWHHFAGAAVRPAREKCVSDEATRGLYTAMSSPSAKSPESGKSGPFSPNVATAAAAIAGFGASGGDDLLNWADLTDKSGDDKSNAPSARTYFSLASHQSRLLFFGGFGDSKGRFNDLRSFDTETKKWVSHPNVGDAPKPIYLHTSVVYQNKMWVFGGSVGKDVNDFYVLDLDRWDWKKVEGMTGAVPPARYGHAAVICEGKMYVVGGCRRNSHYFQDSFAYDFAKKRWEKFGDVPVDMAYHSLCTYNGRVYLFGGYNGSKFVEHLYVLDHQSKQWEAVKVTGSKPSPRCGCAAMLVDKSLFVFGGYTADGHTNDLYRLNMDSNVWETLEAKGSKPISRAYLQAAVVEGALYVFGGYDGSKCVTDFRRLGLVPPPVDLHKYMLREKDSKAHVAYAFKHFSKSKSGSLDEKELELLLAHLSVGFANHLKTLPASSTATAVSSPVADPAAEAKARALLQELAAFDPMVIQSACGMGFSREQALYCLKEMQAAQQDTTNLNILIDKLTTTDFSTKNLQSLEPSGPPALNKQKSEKSELSEKLQNALAAQQDMQQCKVCFDSVMDCVLQSCGHLTVCMKCGEDMKKKQLPCPICRKKIVSCLRVFWT